ncbi:MAG: hypothetical protein H0Z33_02790 [Bacillaceae bacterium]|nr:hypothetical protein [Bacillaceae bacterium]
MYEDGEDLSEIRRYIEKTYAVPGKGTPTPEPPTS